MSSIDKSLKRFLKIAFWEGLSLLILYFIAMPIKYGLGNPIPVKIFGMAHGILFILYVLFLIQVVMAHEWPFKKWALAMIVSIVPCGTFWFEKRLDREAAEQELAEASLKVKQ